MKERENHLKTRKGPMFSLKDTPQLRTRPKASLLELPRGGKQLEEGRNASFLVLPLNLYSSRTVI